MNGKPCGVVSEIQLQKLVDGTADPFESELLEDHLNGCDACQAKLMAFADPDHQWDVVAPMLRKIGIEPRGLPKSTPFEATVDIFIDGEPADASQVSASQFVAPKQNDLLELNHSPALDPPSHPELLGRIGDFEIEKEIGRGGCGIVYKGFDSELNRPVAIKVLSPQLASNGIAKKRFAREAQAVAAVRHPNVVEIHRVSKDAATPYIVMALVPGQSLEARVRQDGPFDLLDSVRIAAQIASGLSAAHRQGLIHRDIKPANILIEHDNNRVLITDFGLARAVDDAGMTQTGWLAGTPHYMSPEQASGEPIDCRSDLFSLGSVIYFLATGREPFRAEKPFAVLQKIVHKQPTPIQNENPTVTTTLARIVERLFEKDPNERFQSASDVQETLESYLAHLQNPSGHAAPVIRLKSSTQKQKRNILWPAVMAVAMIGIVGLAIPAATWFFGSENNTIPSQTGLSATTSGSVQEFDSTSNQAKPNPFTTNAPATLNRDAPLTSFDTSGQQLDQTLDAFEQNFAGTIPPAAMNGTVSPALDSVTELMNELEQEIESFESSDWIKN